MAIFEDQFMDIQIRMVSLAMEYVQRQAETIYIYGISEQEIISYNVFFKINDSIVKIHQVNSVLTNKVNASDEMLFSVLRYGNEDLQALIDLCDDNGHEHPTEIWLTYDVKSNHLETKYSYEGRYDKDEELLLDPVDEFEKWFEEVQAEANK